MFVAILNFPPLPAASLLLLLLFLRLLFRLLLLLLLLVLALSLFSPFTSDSRRVIRDLPSLFGYAEPAFFLSAGLRGAGLMKALSSWRWHGGAWLE